MSCLVAKFGITNEEFTAFQQSGSNAVWILAEQALVDAVDQLCANGQIKDETWNVLSAHYDKHTLMDIL